MHIVSPLHLSIFQLQMKNTIFSLQLVESMNVKPGIWRAHCILIEKNFMYKWTRAAQTCVVQWSSVSPVYNFGKNLRQC